MPPVNGLARLRPAAARLGSADRCEMTKRDPRRYFAAPSCAPFALGLKPPARRCGSSVVEHSLGKGEVRVQSSLTAPSSFCSEFRPGRLASAGMRQPAIRVAYRGQNAGIAGIFRSRAAPRTGGALQVTERASHSVTAAAQVGLATARRPSSMTPAQLRQDRQRRIRCLTGPIEVGRIDSRRNPSAAKGHRLDGPAGILAAERDRRIGAEQRSGTI